MTQGQAYWYSYKTRKIYHALDTHAYFFYNFEKKELDEQKLKIFGVSIEDIRELLKRWNDNPYILHEIKMKIVNKGWGIRFGINTESLYFQMDFLNEKKLKIIKSIPKRIKAPMERKVTVDTTRAIFCYDSVNDFLKGKRRKSKP